MVYSSGFAKRFINNIAKYRTTNRIYVALRQLTVYCLNGPFSNSLRHYLIKEYLFVSRIRRIEIEIIIGLLVRDTSG